MKTTTMTDPVLELVGVSKHYDGFSLRDVTFSLERGYIMGFIGPNGAGKSTTIKLILNLVKKSGGQIRLFGLDHIEHELEIKDRIGFVNDDNLYYEDLTVREMKNVVRGFYSKWDEGAFSRYLKDFNLPSDKPIKQLSKGMKMKFSLAIALSHNAELLIMDEPTSGLDPLVRNELLDILQTVIEDGDKSVFFSSHITSDLDKIADYITFIHNGSVLLSMTKEELLEEYCVAKGGREALAALDRGKLIGVKEQAFGFEALARREDVAGTGAGIVMEKPTLEDLMLYMTRGGTGHVASR
jgi:ABC-2 type transport system ATP-binding protein